jgi:hypothetical protein
MKWVELAQEIVPTGKAVIWISGAVGTSFLAGIGWMTSTSAISETVDKVPILTEEVNGLADRVNTVEIRLNDADEDRQRILCLLTLTATGEALSPFEVAERCP